jgi:type VI secretion system Hcp family effector
MKSIRLILGLLTVAGFAAAEDTISIRVDGVGTCAVQAWSFGATNSAQVSTSGGSGVGKAAFAPLMVTKAVDSCTTGLMKAVASGNHISTMTLTQTDSNGKTLMTVQLQNAFVVSDQVGGTTTTAIPAESVAFTYQKIAVTSYGPSGNGTFGWDLAANRIY